MNTIHEDFTQFIFNRTKDAPDDAEYIETKKQYINATANLCSQLTPLQAQQLDCIVNLIYSVTEKETESAYRQGFWDGMEIDFARRRRTEKYVLQNQ